MKMAYILFDRMTMLDFVGFYDAIAKLRILKLMDNVTRDLCAMSGEVTDELGLTAKAGLVAPDLSSHDLLFVPGGMGRVGSGSTANLSAGCGRPRTFPGKFRYARGLCCSGQPAFWKARRRRPIRTATICWRPIAPKS